MAYAGISVVVLATVGALVVLPAILALLGLRVNAWPVRLPFGRPGLRRRDRRRVAVLAPHGHGGHEARRSRRPCRSSSYSASWRCRFLHVNFGTPDDRVLNPGAAARQVGDVLRTDFSTDAANTTDVVTSRPLDPGQAAAYSRPLSALPGVKSVSGPAGVWVAGRPVPLSPTLLAATSAPLPEPERQLVLGRSPPTRSAAPARTLVGTVRALPVPGGATSYVGGAAASLVDQKHDLGSQLPLAIGADRPHDLRHPVAVHGQRGAAGQGPGPQRPDPDRSVLGLMVWIFQYGHLSGLLDFTPLPMSTTMPLLLFCIAFGLSMDYEVFVLSRIKELHDAGASNQEAVVGGLARTGRIVTTAAVLMSVTFFSFAMSKVSFIQMFALGTGPGRADRRHPDPRRPGAGLHAARRRLELVVTCRPAPAAPAASASRKAAAAAEIRYRPPAPACSVLGLAGAGRLVQAMPMGSSSAEWPLPRPPGG